MQRTSLRLRLVARKVGTDGAGGYKQLLNRADKLSRKGLKLPAVTSLIQAPYAPNMKTVMQDLDNVGYMWTDQNTSQLLMHLIDKCEDFVNLPDAYVEEEVCPILHTVNKFGNAVVNGKWSQYRLLTLYAIAGEKEVLDQKLVALKEKGPLTVECYHALIKGFRIRKNPEKVQEVLDTMAQEGTAMSLYVLQELGMLYTENMMLSELERLLEAHSGNILSERALSVGTVVAIDNGEPGLALSLLLEAVQRGFDDLDSREYQKAKWRVFFEIQTKEQAKLGVELLKLLFVPGLDKRSVPRPTFGEVHKYAAYVAPYDALITRCHELRLQEPANEAFEIILKHPGTAWLSKPSCHALLTLNSVIGTASSEKLSEVLMHMQQYRIEACYATLQHLQVAIDSTWDHLVLQAATLYCQNVEDRLIYYLPGFREYKNTRPAIGGPNGLKAFLKNSKRVVVPHESYMLKHFQELLEEAAASRETQILVPYSTLSALQMIGDEMREQQVEGYDDHALKALGMYAAHNNGAAIFGIAEQRVCSDVKGATEAGLDPLSDADKLAALASCLHASSTSIVVEIRTSSPEENSNIDNALARMGVEGDVKVLDV